MSLRFSAVILVKCLLWVNVKNFYFLSKIIWFIQIHSLLLHQVLHQFPNHPDLLKEGLNFPS